MIRTLALTLLAGFSLLLCKWASADPPVSKVPACPSCKKCAPGIFASSSGWQWTDITRSYTSGEPVDITLRDKNGANVGKKGLPVKVTVIREDGTRNTAQRVLKENAPKSSPDYEPPELRLRYPKDFEGANELRTELLTVIWETAGGKMLLCFKGKVTTK